jgi:hypothetical protein
MTERSRGTRGVVHASGGGSTYRTLTVGVAFADYDQIDRLAAELNLPTSVYTRRLLRLALRDEALLQAARQRVDPLPSKPRAKQARVLRVWPEEG